MNVTYINPFLIATADLFAKMIKMPLKLGKPAIRQADERLYKLYRVSAVMDFEGGITGRIVLSFAQPVAFALAGALAGRKFEELDDEALDAIGEIANMIVGAARSNIPKNADVRVSTPKVIDTVDVMFPSDMPVIVIPFDTAAGRFVVEVAINSGQASKIAPATTTATAPATAPAAPAPAAAAPNEPAAPAPATATPDKPAAAAPVAAAA